MGYSPEEILLKIKQVSLIAQKAKKGQTPDYYPTYKMAVENWKAIKTHADRSIFPEEVFSKRAPNQTEKATQWLRENYKNVTQPVYLDFKNTITQTFQDSNWNIDYSDDDDIFLASQKGFEQYVEQDLTKYTSLEGFVRDLLPDLKLQDAMGLICVKPEYIPTVKNELDELVIAGDTLIEPMPFFYHCDQVVGYEDSKYFIVELKEKSKLSDNSMTGRIYEFFDDTNIYRAIQYGKMSDNTFALELFFNHNFGEVPARRAGGIPLMCENEILWISPFLFAVDLLDIVSVVSAYLFAMTTKTAFPATIVVGNPCDFEENGNKCENGMISVMGGEGYNYHKCPKCMGTGEVSRLGVFDTLILRPADRMNPNAEAEINSTQPPLQYVSPNVDILDFNEKYIEKREQKARQILHLHTSNTSVKGSVDMTATGDSIDLKQKYAFIAPNAFQLFSIYEFLLNGIGWMRYGEKYNPPTLTYPATFDMESESDILAGIVEMIKGGIPTIVVKANISRYLKAIFFTDKEASQAFDLIMNTDRILLLSSDEIGVKLAKGLIADWEVILHDSSLTFIEQLEQENEKFFEQPKEIQQKQLIELAKAKADEIRPEPIVIPEAVPTLPTV